MKKNEPAAEEVEIYVEDAAKAIRNPAVPYSKRYDAAFAWVNSLRWLSELLVNDLNLDYARFLVDETSGLSVPVALPEDRWGVQRHSFHAEDGPAFYLSPLVASDAALHPYFKGIVGTASYHEREKTIYLPPSKLGPVWKALILYHEVLHFEHHERRLKDNVEEDHWQEEYEVYRDELQALGQLYGIAYHEAVNTLAARFQPGIEANSLQFKRKIASKELLESIFGKASSPYERSIQRTLVLLDALYRAIAHSAIKHEEKGSYYTSITKWFHGSSQPDATGQSAEK